MRIKHCHTELPDCVCMWMSHLLSWLSQDGKQNRVLSVWGPLAHQPSSGSLRLVYLRWCKHYYSACNAYLCRVFLSAASTSTGSISEANSTLHPSAAGGSPAWFTQALAGEIALTRRTLTSPAQAVPGRCHLACAAMLSLFSKSTKSGGTLQYDTSKVPDYQGAM